MINSPSTKRGSPENSRLSLRLHRRAVGALVIVGAFAMGLWLGHRPAGSEATPTVAPATVANLFASPSRQAEATKAREVVAEPTRTLRVRSTARVSSGEARAGESVLFLTEHDMQTHSGEHVPAGALVEGIIARARPSSSKTPGRLVIEIRALHVGNQAIPLHALPYVPSSVKSPAPATSVDDTRAIDIYALGVRNQLRPNPEAVMPKETVIEFQLVEADQGDNPLRNLPEPISPSPVIRVPSNPTPRGPAWNLPVPDAKPAIPMRRARIATDRG